jgi:hypothetical protein
VWVCVSLFFPNNSLPCAFGPFSSVASPSLAGTTPFIVLGGIRFTCPMHMFAPLRLFCTRTAPALGALEIHSRRRSTGKIALALKNFQWREAISLLFCLNRGILTRIYVHLLIESKHTTDGFSRNLHYILLFVIEGIVVDVINFYRYVLKGKNQNTQNTL